ncbi:MAG: LPXTG cell wall anchor domain-containing protein [Olsenella sp.]|nr:LPXTG cell wall anchor domain-containing protein [Olsenella sp.]
MPESTKRKLSLKVLNARAVVRRHSKRTTLCAIASLALAGALVAPAQAMAADAAAVLDAPQAQAIEQVAPAGERAEALAAVDDGTDSVASEAIATKGVVTEATVAEGSTDGAVASEVAAPEQIASDQTDEAQAMTLSVSSLEQSGADASMLATSAAAANGTDASLSQGGSQVEQILRAAQQASKNDTLGTTIIFDFNGDGVTDDLDWNQYVEWVKTYHIFDFANGNFSEGANGGYQVTGGTAKLVNGSDRGPETLGTGIDVDKIAKYFLNNVGQATSVKNQSPFGSCWAFGSTSALESAILKAMAGDKASAYNAADHQTPKLTGLEDKVDLSELELAWKCYLTQPDGEGATDVYEDDDVPLYAGGWGSMAEVVYTAWQAVCNEDVQPYWPEGVPRTFENFKKLGSADWIFRKHVGEDIIAHVQGVHWLPSPAIAQLDKNEHMVYKGYNENATRLMKEAIIKYGAVAIGYDADSAMPNQPSGKGYFNGEYWAQYNDNMDSLSNTHNVCIVGWDDTFDHNKFKAEDNDVTNLPDGAWLVKNSWGSVDWMERNFPGADRSDYKGKNDKWGIRDAEGNATGYFWLSYYDHSIFDPYFFTVDLASDGFDYDNNYAYDLCINESQLPFMLRTEDKGTEVANVFTAKGNETLRAVSVHSQASNSKAHIRVYLVSDADLADCDPTSGTLVSDFDVDLLLPGYHTVSLPTAIKLRAGQMFAVVENVIGVDTYDGTNADTSDRLTGQSLDDAADEQEKWVSVLNLETTMAPEAWTGENMGYVQSVVTAAPGTTFVKILTADGYKWMTPQALAESLGGGKIFAFGNAMIKAFTTNDDEAATEAPAEKAADALVASAAAQVRTAPVQTAAYHGGLARNVEFLPQTGDPVSGAALAGTLLSSLTLLGAGLGSRRRRNS